MNLTDNNKFYFFSPYSEPSEYTGQICKILKENDPEDHNDFGAGFLVYFENGKEMLVLPEELHFSLWPFDGKVHPIK